MTGPFVAPADSDPRNGDIIIYQERGAPSGPCSVGAFDQEPRTPAATYADGLRHAAKLAIHGHVDVWTTYRVRWADATPQTYRRLARYRSLTQPLP